MIRIPRRSSLGLRRVVLGAALALATTVPAASASHAAPALPSCNGLEATIVGTAGADLLVGTAGDDVIVALGGADTVRGAGGADTICGGAGADTLLGGAGNDILLGGAGADEINGGRGNDTIRGGNQADTAVGARGFDKIFGQAGQDHLDGGLGNDRLRGGAGADELVGGSGNDVCRGDAGFGTAASCESYGVTPAPISIDDFEFGPAAASVPPGTTVLWTNVGNVNHTTTFGTQDPGNRMWDSGVLTSSESFAVTFDATGTFDYICTIHPFMTAFVTVSP